MILSLTINENELSVLDTGSNIKKTILEYLKKKIDKNLLIEIYSVEKKNGNYLIIASIEKDYENKIEYQ